MMMMLMMMVDCRRTITLTSRHRVTRSTQTTRVARTAVDVAPSCRRPRTTTSCRPSRHPARPYSSESRGMVTCPQGACKSYQGTRKI